MNIPILIDTIENRLIRYKLKTFFMMAGIVISVLATILVQTVSVTVKSAFVSYIERSYASNSVMLVAGSGPMGGGAGRYDLTMDDIHTVENTIGGIQYSAPFVNGGQRDIKFQGNNINVDIYGYSENEQYVSDRSVQEGEGFTEGDIRKRSQVALIGEKTAARLFGEDSPVGKTIFIDNIAFEIKGVLDAFGMTPHGGDKDNEIHIPYTTLMVKMLKIDYVNGVRFAIDSPDSVESIANEVKDIMRQLHTISADEQDDFSVITASFLLKLIDKTFKTFDVLLPVVVVIAFLASAGVILGLVFISIRERSAEIGLRKAVGARPNDLMLQILLEVGIVAIVGALIGLAMALMAIHFLSPVLMVKYGTLEMKPSIEIILLSVACALVAGLFAAYLPARRAGKLDPVEALK